MAVGRLIAGADRLPNAKYLNVATSARLDADQLPADGSAAADKSPFAGRKRIQFFDNRDLAGTGPTRLIVEPARFHEFGDARNRTGNCVDVRNIISDIRPASRYLLEFMSSTDVTGPPSPARWGLAAKLFTTLVLLGAIAVLVTGVLGYFRARDALEKAVFDQLTAARQTKTRQIETYFRTIQADLRLLATSKMLVDATREFRIAVDQLDRAGVSPELRQKVSNWYAENFIPGVTRVTGREPALADYLPVGAAPYYLQYHYIVANPNPKERRKLVDDPGDGSDYSRLHSVYHPLMRAAAATVGFFDFMVADAKSGRLIYTVEKEVDFTTSLQVGPYRGSSVAAAVARCALNPDRSAICLEDFAPYGPSRGAPIAFMAAPVIDQGGVIGVLIAQLSNEEIDSVVTGGRRWSQEGFGDTGEAYLVGSDYLVRSGPRAFYEDKENYFAELKSVGASDEEIAAIQRYGTPVLHQRIDTKATRAATRRRRGYGRDHRLPRRPDACFVGTALDFRRHVGPRRQDRQR